jgi:hypothetical protein
VNSRGRRTQRRAAERREEKAERRKRLELQRTYSPRKRKIKNEEETMSFFESMRNVITGEKASKAKTPPMQRQKPVYGDKKMVKAKNPKNPKKGKGK